MLINIIAYMHNNYECYGSNCSENIHQYIGRPILEYDIRKQCSYCHSSKDNQPTRYFIVNFHQITIDTESLIMREDHKLFKFIYRRTFHQCPQISVKFIIVVSYGVGTQSPEIYKKNPVYKNDT